MPSLLLVPVRIRSLNAEFVVQHATGREEGCLAAGSRGLVGLASPAGGLQEKVPMSGLRLSRLVAVLVAMSIVAGGCHTFDSMFKTASHNGNCQDLGSSLPPAGLLNCQTDNSTLTYFTESSITATGNLRIDSRMLTQYEPTDLSVTEESSGDYSGGSETDIIFQQNSGLPSGVAGRAWCDDAVSSTKCDQHYVAYASATPPSSTICHEIGHSIGLTHGASADPAQLNTSSAFGCMQTPSSGGGSALTPEMTHQIDNTY